MRALREEQRSFSTDVWRQLADLGWLGIEVPEAAGGLELGTSELAIVAEGLGRARLPEPYTRAALRQALRVLEHDSGSAEAEMAASRAKARASSAAMTVARQAVQLHGAIGYTEEADVGVHLHRVVTLSAWLGNAAWHRRRYAELLPRETTEAA